MPFKCALHLHLWTNSIQSFGASGVRWWWRTFRPLLPRRFNQWPQSHWLNLRRSRLHRSHRKPPMPNPLPKMNRINPPMTQGQRRVWLALEEQKRRRARAAGGLAPSLTITLAGSVINIVQVGPDQGIAIAIQRSDDGNFGESVDGDKAFGATTWDLSGEAAGYYRICFEAEDGSAIAPFSNIIQFAPSAPAILLASDGHGHLTWTLNFTSSFGQINIYKSADGVTWPSDAYDGWDLASGSRDCSGDPGWFRICICDDNGVDVPPYSNAVHSDGL